MASKTTKSKFFRAFVEGQTISDGRTVTAEMIDQAVETFNPETYTPGINIEHLSGFSPEAPFNRYGDVIAVKAQIDDITVAGKTEKRKALYAQVEALDSLVTLASNGQKPFPSVELTGDYAGTKKVGLVGLAFTDNPASIATQKLNFSQHATITGNVIASGAEAVALEFEPKHADEKSMFDAIRGAFTAFAATLKPGEPDKPKEAPKEPANDNFDAASFASSLGETMATAMAAAIKPVTEAQTAFNARFATLEGKLASIEDPGQFRRTPTPGGNTGELTDC